MKKDKIRLVLDNKVPQCDLESDLCANSTAELIGEVLSIASSFINLVHFILLCNLRTLKGKPYWSVLVAMCCEDIWLSVGFTPTLNCQLRTFLNTAAPFPTLWNLIIYILLESGALFRYLVWFAYQLLRGSLQYVSLSFIDPTSL